MTHGPNPTGRPIGRPPKSDAAKHHIGNPGGRPLRQTPVAPAIDPEGGVREPHRPLGAPGADTWARLWHHGAAWLTDADREVVLILAENIDERSQLRELVLTNADWRHRSALRALDAQIVSWLSALGFTPADRARLGLGEPQPLDALELFRAQHPRH